VDYRFGKLSFQHCKIRDLFLVGFDFTEGGDIVDDTVDPYSFDVRDVATLDLIGNVVIVSFVHLLLSQDLGLQFLLVPVGKTLHLFSSLVKQHLAINYLLFLACHLLLKLRGSLKTVKVGAFVHQSFLIGVDVQSHALERQIAADAMRQRQGEGR